MENCKCSCYIISAISYKKKRKKKTTWPISRPWVLVSELGQRDVAGVGVLGLWVCIGFMEEFKLLRTAFGAAELREWAAAAPRKPERNRKEGAGDEWISGGPVEAQRHHSS